MTSMSFAIETAASTPLSAESLYATLYAAASPDRVQIQSGTQQLQQWERSPGYFSGLQTVYLNHEAPIEVRYLAIIQLKNAIDKYWREGVNAVISPEEKALIRSRSLDAVVAEPETRLALQSALFLARVVRAEFPKKW